METSIKSCSKFECSRPVVDFVTVHFASEEKKSQAIDIKI